MPSRLNPEWITQRECASRVGVPEETVLELVSIGAVRYRYGQDVQDFRALVVEADVQHALSQRAAAMLRAQNAADNPEAE